MIKTLKNAFLRIKLLPALLLVLPCISWGNTAVANNSPQTEGWHFLVAPYLWGSAVSGDVTLQGGRTRDFYLSFGDILRHFEFGVQAHMEASHGPWTLMLDPTYLRLSAERDQGLIRPSLTSQIVLVDAGIFYRLFSTPISPNQFVSFELLGGARYLNINNQLDFPIGLSVEDHTQLTSPIVGGRFKADITPNTHAWLRGDVGGFHVDNVNTTWSGSVGLSYSLNSHVELGLAYRVLKVDFDKGNTVVDILMYGPMAGAVFHF